MATHGQEAAGLAGGALFYLWLVKEDIPLPVKRQPTTIVAGLHKLRKGVTYQDGWQYGQGSWFVFKGQRLSELRPWRKGKRTGASY